MALLETLRKDKMQALKEKDTLKNGVCSLLIAALALAETEKGDKLTAQEEYSYVQRELKQTKDALVQTPTDRKDLLAETEKKIDMIEGYLPKQLTMDEIEAAIQDIMKEKELAPILKNRGILMKEMMSKYADKTDGKRVNAIVSKLLK